MKILLVDDVDDVKMFYSKILESWGHEVTTANNGCEALQMIRQLDIHLVICDWLMPEMSGLQLCNELRSLTLDHYVYIIMVTSKSKSDDVVEGLSAGADDFISKPFSTDILKARINSAIRIIEMENKLADMNHLLIKQNKYIKTAYEQLDNNMKEAQKLIGDTEVIVLKTSTA